MAHFSTCPHVLSSHLNKWDDILNRRQVHVLHLKLFFLSLAFNNLLYDICIFLNIFSYSFLQIKQCDVCDSGGPNLWICLHNHCLVVVCGEAGEDHSTKHGEVISFQLIQYWYT